MSDPRFTDRLLTADSSTPTARERYDQKVRVMLNNELSPRERGGFLLGAVFSLIVAGLFGFVAATADGPTNAVIPYVKAYMGLTATVTVIAAVLLLRAFWRGTIRRPGGNGVTAGLGVGYLALVGWLLMLMAGHAPEALRNDTRVFGGLLVVYAAVAWVRSRIARAELATAERLLELELRLAEMQEAMKAGLS